MVTLVGLGGAGKTRLALQIALNVLERFADGAFFVDLANIDDPALIPGVLAATLDLRETASHRSLIDSLRSYLHGKQLLLVLDNCEQVISAAPLIADLVQFCPPLKVLATSRTPLRVRIEREYPLSPFEGPVRQEWHDLTALWCS